MKLFDVNGDKLITKELIEGITTRITNLNVGEQFDLNVKRVG